VRILFTESSNNLGGQELQLLQQLSILPEYGAECRLVCRAGSRISEQGSVQGVALSHAPFARAIDTTSIRALRSIVAQWRPDAIVAHGSPDFYAARLAIVRTSPRPALFRVKTYHTGGHSGWLHSWLSDGVLVPSEFLRRTICTSRLPRHANIHVLYPGVQFYDTKESVQDSMKGEMAKEGPTAQADLSHPVICHVAMLRGEKGHLFMLDVVAALKDRYPSIRYVIIGDGPERERVESRIRDLKLTRHVVMLGFLSSPHEQVLASTVAVNPATVEPLGMSQIEALGLGVPVVANRAGGIPETFIDKHHGALCEPGSVDQWVASLKEIFEDEKAARVRAEMGSRWVRSRFSCAENAEKLVSMISAHIR